TLYRRFLVLQRFRKNVRNTDSIGIRLGQ
ncbi:mazG family protein, partial [Vibrio parahaemolyticus VPTS-2010]